MCPVTVPITGSSCRICDPGPQNSTQLWKFLHILQIMNHFFFNAEISDLFLPSFITKIYAVFVLSKIVLSFSGIEEIKTKWRTKIIFLSACTKSPLITLYPCYPSTTNI